MEIRVLVVVLLSGAVICEVRKEKWQKRGVSSGRDSSDVPGTKLLANWYKLELHVRYGSTYAAGEDCNATVDQSYLYFLLGDLLEFHKVDGILAYGFPRRGFYEKQFEELHRVGDRGNDKERLLQPEVVFCDYDFRLVCIENKCVSCDNVPADVDKLKTACGWKGEGGKEATDLSPPKEGDLAKPETLEKPQEEECGEGWLTAENVMKWHQEIEEYEKHRYRESRADCTFNFDLQRGFYLLDHVVRNLTEAGQLEAELQDYGDFYEEKLWMFRDGKNTRNKFCMHDAADNLPGPWVCGIDALCVDCDQVADKDYSTNPPSELVAGCKVKGRPADRVKKEVRCATTTTTTEGSSGVRMEGKRAFVIASAFVLIGFTATTD